jgi:hypothetical protein
MGKAFAKKLKTGQLGESLIAKWLNSKGWFVVPVYEIEINSGKGPRVFAPDNERIIAPDIFAVNPLRSRVRFIECKHKTVFTWHRISQKWQTGIDLKHWADYLKLSDKTGVDTWLLFLHRQSTPSLIDIHYGCPTASPVGLFGQSIKTLKDKGRKDDRYAKGMIYWNHGHLQKLAHLEEVTRLDPALAQSEEIAS